MTLLGAITRFLWIVEILRYVSPSFRGHYNRLFSSIMRKQELVEAAVEIQEGTLAYSVDQVVKQITTPLLGELPSSPTHASPMHNNNGPHLRTAAATSSTVAASAFATPAEYQKQARPPHGPVASPRAAAAINTAAAGHTPATVTSEKIFTGTGFFFLGNWLAMLLFEPTIATCAMLFLVLGDMTAAIIGISFGTIKIGKKSLEGTIAMFLVCTTIGAIFFLTTPGSALPVLLAALAATLVELFGPADRWWADDNLTIPMATGIAFTTAFHVFNGGVPQTQQPPSLLS